MVPQAMLDAWFPGAQLPLAVRLQLEVDGAPLGGRFASQIKSCRQIATGLQTPKELAGRAVTALRQGPEPFDLDVLIDTQRRRDPRPPDRASQLSPSEAETLLARQAAHQLLAGGSSPAGGQGAWRSSVGQPEQGQRFQFPGTGVSEPAGAVSPEEGALAGQFSGSGQLMRPIEPLLGQQQQQPESLSAAAASHQPQQLQQQGRVQSPPIEEEQDNSCLEAPPQAGSCPKQVGGSGKPSAAAAANTWPVVRQPCLGQHLCAVFSYVLLVGAH